MKLSRALHWSSIFFIWIANWKENVHIGFLVEHDTSLASTKNAWSWASTKCTAFEPKQNETLLRSHHGAWTQTYKNIRRNFQSWSITLSLRTFEKIIIVSITVFDIQLEYPTKSNLIAFSSYSIIKIKKFNFSAFMYKNDVAK